MARLEDLERGAQVRGVLPSNPVTVHDVRWYGTNCLELIFRDAEGRLDSALMYRDNESQLEIVTQGRPWSFDSDGELYRLVSESQRIRLAYLFDPLLAVHTSLIDPLPHQITAVYGEMLPRQPLRYILADDPGAGKTIMAGMLLKELMMRGDVRRCLICAPGNLVEQWQDELRLKFALTFEIFSRGMAELSPSGNPFAEHSLLICRLDQLARNEEYATKLQATDWDLIICDEAHKMSAHFYSGELTTTHRYRLGQLLGSITRHFLLLTATPHNGVEEDFQLFMALLDADRFEGRFRDGVHQVDTSDLMRRMLKEDMVRFDNTHLFPERRAYTVGYALSDAEARLYADVTEYVREEMNRADRLMAEGEGRRGNMVGFALTILQRRLASSPEAIYCSLKRRRERLEDRLREEKPLKRGAEISIEEVPLGVPDAEETDDYYDEAPSEEVEETEERVVDQATAARTIAELEREIQVLSGLESQALQIRRSGHDRKWEELSGLLQGSGDAEATSEVLDAQGRRRKLIVFTEHRDTLNYLAGRIRTLVGRPDSVVIIHGSMGREERRKAQEFFTQDKDAQILVATDAAGEGINLQSANLMVNYDLPWNPNRIEQRFGRIHRIGQTEVCHLWNLVAEETREGSVFKRLLEKLRQQRDSLGDRVFDVLGESFGEVPLRKLLIEAIRYGERPEVRARLTEQIDRVMDMESLLRLLEERALTHQTLARSRVQQIREQMERAQAQRLHPHHIASYFRKAFAYLGGTLHEREPLRYEITHVPAAIRNRDRQIGRREPVLSRYERITFHKELISVADKPLAAFVCPGHPLLDATLDLLLERHREVLKRGAVLVDPDNRSEGPRALFYLQHAIQDARQDASGNRRTVSQRLQFVELDEQGAITDAGYAPYLDYRPIREDERAAIASALEAPWLQGDLEGRATAYAVEHIVPQHMQAVLAFKEDLIVRTMSAVKERLTKEISYWDHRAEELKLQELAGRRNARLNSALARQRADDLQARLQRRMEELEWERHLAPQPPLVIGGALIVPESLLPRTDAAARLFAESTKERERLDRLAVAKVLEAERRLGHEPREMPHAHPGYDIESLDPHSGSLRFIEVKGKGADSSVVTVSRTQIITSLNRPDTWVLALVSVDGDEVGEPLYVWRPFTTEPEFTVTSVNYDYDRLRELGSIPT